MISVHHLGLFVLSGLLLNITPGQDTLYIVGRTMSQGRSDVISLPSNRIRAIQAPMSAPIDDKTIASSTTDVATGRAS